MLSLVINENLSAEKGCSYTTCHTKNNNQTVNMALCFRHTVDSQNTATQLFYFNNIHHYLAESEDRHHHVLLITSLIMTVTKNSRYLEQSCVGTFNPS